MKSLSINLFFSPWFSYVLPLWHSLCFCIWLNNYFLKEKTKECYKKCMWYRCSTVGHTFIIVKIEDILLSKYVKL